MAMAGIIENGENMINAAIKAKIDDLDFNSIFSSKITPKLEETVKAGVEKLFNSYSFQDAAAKLFNKDLFKVYDDALTDCAVVKKMIDENNNDTTAAFTLFIKKIQDAAGDKTQITLAKQDFLDNMKAIDTKQTGGKSILTTQNLKQSFKDQANKIGAMPTSQATAVSGETMTDVLTQINTKIKEASDKRKTGIQKLIDSQSNDTKVGGKSKKTKGGKSKKKRRKRTYKRR